MPELPEVETVVKGLEKSITGKRILSVQLSGKKMRVDIPSNFIEVVKDKVITNVTRRAKYILIGLENEHSIVIHLGMSGKVLAGAKLESNKHDHAKFKLSNNISMVFNDPRRFGLITCVHNNSLLVHPLFKNLGVEPLTTDFTGSYIKKLSLKRSGNIKSFIMNGNLIVGVGNIYASESLFRSAIHPLTCTGSIRKTQASLLATVIKEVLKKAIESGGSTLRDYVRSSGDIGNFQHKLMVYGRAGKLCVKCNSSIEKIIISNRATYFCPSCQKL